VAASFAHDRGIDGISDQVFVNIAALASGQCPYQAVAGSMQTNALHVPPMKSIPRKRGRARF